MRQLAIGNGSGESAPFSRRQVTIAIGSSTHRFSRTQSTPVEITDPLRPRGARESAKPIIGKTRAGAIISAPVNPVVTCGSRRATSPTPMLAISAPKKVSAIQKMIMMRIAMTFGVRAGAIVVESPAGDVGVVQTNSVTSPCAINSPAWSNVK